ncbi:MAG: sigma-70 family RNA polymerase sigma factor [Clostridia bacterium]|nr:sigma-70 family RNA polymerase sigma factor [Clostridia bacterium]
MPTMFWLYRKEKKYSLVKFIYEDSNNDPREEFLVKAGKFENGFLSRVDYNLVLEAIRKMPEIYRDTLMLKFYHDCGDKEMAQIFGISESAVRKRVERARAILRQRTKEK